MLNNKAESNRKKGKGRAQITSSVPRSAMRSTIDNAQYADESRKKVPLRSSIFFIWRSGLTRGAETKNSNSTSPPPLLLCCCCCAAASADPRSAIHRGARSAMLIRDAYRCSISFIWRSGLTRGAGTKNSNFTLPQRVEEL